MPSSLTLTCLYPIVIFLTDSTYSFVLNPSWSLLPPRAVEFAVIVLMFAAAFAPSAGASPGRYDYNPNDQTSYKRWRPAAGGHSDQDDNCQAMARCGTTPARTYCFCTRAERRSCSSDSKHLRGGHEVAGLASHAGVLRCLSIAQHSLPVHGLFVGQGTSVCRRPLLLLAQRERASARRESNARPCWGSRDKTAPSSAALLQLRNLSDDRRDLGVPLVGIGPPASSPQSSIRVHARVADRHSSVLRRGVSPGVSARSHARTPGQFKHLRWTSNPARGAIHRRGLFRLHR